MHRYIIFSKNDEKIVYRCCTFSEKMDIKNLFQQGEY